MNLRSGSPRAGAERPGAGADVRRAFQRLDEPAVIGPSLLESPPTQARSLEGRPLGMGNSRILPELSTLNLLEPGSSFVTALREQRRPMTGLNELRE